MKKKMIAMTMALMAMTTSAWAAMAADDENSQETPQAISINETNFPDEAFRSYLLAHFGKDELTAEDITATEALEVKNLKIADLTGIGFFTALTTLDCSNNKLTALNVTQNTALQSLNCSYNYTIEELDLSQNTELKVLRCSNNKLTELDTSHNEQIDSIQCQYNQLTTLDLTADTSLVYLACQGNQIYGDGMWQLVRSLPKVKAGFLYVLHEAYKDEQNVCTKAQVAVATEKGWRVRAHDPETNKYVAYEGSDDELIAGDVNADGEVGIGDIVAITNVMAGIETDEGIVSRANVNGDDEVGIGDIVAITNIMAGANKE